MLKHRGEGDSTLCVFERASDAVVAAAAVVDAVAAEPWAVEPPIRLRVSVHTGEVELRDGDYFGGTLDRAARCVPLPCRMRSCVRGRRPIW